MIYNSLIASHLLYGLKAYGEILLLKNEINWKKYKKAIRNIAAAKYNEHTVGIFKSLKILKFLDLITFNTSIKYKYAHMALINLFSNELVYRRSK